MNDDILMNEWAAFRNGSRSSIQMAEMLLALGSSQEAKNDLGLCLDDDRTRRCGFPEVIYGQGKSTEAVCSAIDHLLKRTDEILVTRASIEQSEAVAARFPFTRWESSAKCLRVGSKSLPLSPEAWSAEKTNNPRTYVAVVSAGTTDLNVALEARETLTWMQTPSILIQDVGVAGPYRLLKHLSTLRMAAAVIVVAGMEAALASVVGGQVAVPVIAVPTSVGYGASLGGIAALLGMLNSCASNVTVVNIDAGFKGAYVAGLMCHNHSKDRP